MKVCRRLWGKLYHDDNRAGKRIRGSGNAMNNYSSKAFDKLLANREIIAQRIESKYSGLKYPDVGFIHDKGLGECLIIREQIM